MWQEGSHLRCRQLSFGLLRGERNLADLPHRHGCGSVRDGGRSLRELRVHRTVLRCQASHVQHDQKVRRDQLQRLLRRGSLPVRLGPDRLRREGPSLPKLQRGGHHVWSSRGRRRTLRRHRPMWSGQLRRLLRRQGNVRRGHRQHRLRSRRRELQRLYAAHSGLRAARPTQRPHVHRPSSLRTAQLQRLLHRQRVHPRKSGYGVRHQGGRLLELYRTEPDVRRGRPVHGRSCVRSRQLRGLLPRQHLRDRQRPGRVWYGRPSLQGLRRSRYLRSGRRLPEPCV
jgi:hypothetical protein